LLILNLWKGGEDATARNDKNRKGANKTNK